MTTLEKIVSLALVVTALLTACGSSKPKVAVGVSDAAKPTSPSAQDSEDLNKQIVSAIQGGRYADAVVLARQANVSKVDADFAVGELILEGHSDASAAQGPRESIEEGLLLIEAAAVAGHQQAISALAATFHTGLPQGTSDAFFLKPDAGLHRCWEAAKASPQTARACVDLRRKH